MADPKITYRFFENGDKYGQANFASLIRALLTSGYIPTVGGELKPTVSTASPRTVSISMGMAVLNGYILELENASYNITLDAPHETLKRIDRIVARLTTNTATRGIAFAVLKGTPAAEPTVPSITKTDSIWELPIARVAMNPGTTMLPDSALTDERVPAYNNASGLPALPKASGDKYGIVKIGSGVTVNNGVISVSTPFPMRANMTLTDTGFGAIIRNNVYASMIGNEPLGISIANKDAGDKTCTWSISVSETSHYPYNVTVKYIVQNVFTGEKRELHSETKHMDAPSIIVFTYSTNIKFAEICMFEGSHDRPAETPNYSENYSGDTTVYLIHT